MSKEAMKLALDAITTYLSESPDPSEEAVEGLCDARAILRQALAEQPAQQEPFGYFKAEPFGWTDCAETDEGAVALYERPAQQEPVAWPCLIAEADFSADTVTLAMQCTDYKVSAGEHWLSNTPPAQRTWVGLTDEEIEKLTVELRDIPVTLAFAIEAKLRSKNEDRN